MTNTAKINEAAAEQLRALAAHLRTAAPYNTGFDAESAAYYNGYDSGQESAGESILEFLSQAEVTA